MNSLSHRRHDTSLCSGSISNSDHPYTTRHHGSLPLPAYPLHVEDDPLIILWDGTTRAEARQIRQDCEEFITFFENLKSVVAHLFSLVRSDRTWLQSKRATMFEKGSPTHELISIPHGRRPGVVGQRTGHCLHLSILCYISAALLEVSDNEADTDDFLASLQATIVRRSLCTNYSHSDMLFALFNGVQGETKKHRPERAWLVSRLMSIARRLGTESWNSAVKTLLIFLEVPREMAYADAEPPIWDTDHLRREILSDLYVKTWS